MGLADVARVPPCGGLVRTRSQPSVGSRTQGTCRRTDACTCYTVCSVLSSGTCMAPPASAWLQGWGPWGSRSWRAAWRGARAVAAFPAVLAPHTGSGLAPACQAEVRSESRPRVVSQLVGLVLVPAPLPLPTPAPAPAPAPAPEQEHRHLSQRLQPGHLALLCLHLRWRRRRLGAGGCCSCGGGRPRLSPAAAPAPPPPLLPVEATP